MFYISLVDLNSNIVILHNNKLLKFKKINGKYVACINEAQATLTFIYHHELDTHLWFLKAFIFYGYDVVKHLNGIFAFAIWNASKEEVFVARDHFGVKPFFYP